MYNCRFYTTVKKQIIEVSHFTFQETFKNLFLVQFSYRTKKNLKKIFEKTVSTNPFLTAYLCKASLSSCTKMYNGLLGKQIGEAASNISNSRGIYKSQFRNVQITSFL